MMQPRRALKAILAIALLGVAFSGVLTYREFFGAPSGTCPTIGSAETVLGQPPCIYGLVMYVVLAVVAGFGLRSKPQPPGTERRA